MIRAEPRSIWFLLSGNSVRDEHSLALLWSKHLHLCVPLSLRRSQAQNIIVSFHPYEVTKKRSQLKDGEGPQPAHFPLCGRIIPHLTPTAGARVGVCSQEALQPHLFTERGQ